MKLKVWSEAQVDKKVFILKYQNNEHIVQKMSIMLSTWTFLSSRCRTMPEKLDFITPTFLKVLYLFHENPMKEKL